MKKALITGITGFVGQHLARHLLKTNNYEVYGTYRSESYLEKFDGSRDEIVFKHADLDDAKAVEQVISEVKPDFLFHLAAQASPVVSFKSPLDTLTTNITSELHILEAVKNYSNQTRVLAVATGEMYGVLSPEDIPVDEMTPLKPISPYSVSKIASDYLALQYHLAFKLDVVRVRPFNHIGPGQREGFVVADFAKQIVEIEKGKKEPVLHVGNLDARRDFTDVRDMVRAYVLALEKGVSGDVYNLGSGKSYKIRDMLDTLLSYSTQKVEVAVDPAKIRPIDVPEVRCDYSKFTTVTGWNPEIPFEKTLEEILDYWRKIV
jgi:GDP-4-dehydro-6-deoxy-D-mannose reductase